jgi:hypothetical protein
VGLALVMEIMSIFNPHVIGPSLQVQYKIIKESGFSNFMCPCSSWFKDEPSWRCHLNMSHRESMEFICQFTDTYDRLPLLDLSLFGNTSERHELDPLLGPIDD